MERAGKKRIRTTDEKEEEEEKIEQDHDDDDEEEKIEEFFAIIKRLREARNSITNSNGLHELEVRNKDAKKVRVQGPAWIPVFELEDFAGLERDDNASTSNRFSMKKDISKGKEKEIEEKGLDLNLSL